MQKLTLGLIGGGGVALVLSLGLGWLALPQAIRSVIKKASRLEQGTVTFQTWQNPTQFMDISLKVYFFNVTNPEGIQKGEKPAVKEVGPYVYSEKRMKIGIERGEFPDTIKYREKVYLEFRREMSSGDKEDLVTFLSLPFVGMAKMTTTLTDSEFILGQLDSQLAQKGETLFRADTIQNVLFDGFSIRNYIDILEDPLVEIAVGKVRVPNFFRGGKFALYKGKNGSDDGLYEVNSGRESYKQFGSIHKWNNRTKLSWWKGDSCNDLSGTDGSLFPPFLLRQHVLKSFSSELCRTLALQYEEDVQFKGIPGFRFAPATQAILGPHRYQPNRCFCSDKDASVCNRNGLMLLSNCKEGAPVSLSSPHFYDADSAIIDAIAGMQPVKDKHKTFLDIEPTTGVVMRAAKRLQFNVDVSPCPAMPSIANIRKLVFPVFWAEERTELPEEHVHHLSQLLHTQSKMETARWSLVGVSLVCICLGILWLRLAHPPPTQIQSD